MSNSLGQPEANLPWRFYNGNSALYSPKLLQRGTKFKSRGHLTTGPKAVTPTPFNPVMLTPPPTVKSPSPMPSPPKRKRQRVHFVNYLDDDESIQKRRSRRLKSQSPPDKYAKKAES